MNPARKLIIACGNPLRGDDGLGPALIDRLSWLDRSDIETDVDYQLNIEDAVTVAAHERILFVDASVTAPSPFLLKPLAPSSEIAFTSHRVTPGTVLAICHDHFDHRPEAWVMAIRGFHFELGEGLSVDALGNLEEAFIGVIEWLER